MDEPKEGATTLKKKAQEKLAAKANPVSEAVSEPIVIEAVSEVSEPIVIEAVSEVPAEVVVPDVVLETEAAAE